MATKRQSRVIVGRLFHRERVDLRAHQNLWGYYPQLAETNKKRLLLNRSLSKHRLGLRWEKGDSAPLKTPGLLTDDGLREMMKALSGAVDGVGTSRCRNRRIHGPNSARTREGRGPLKASKRRAQLLTINIKFAPRRLV